jgi:xylan 1,4-beta-xylosidase
MPFHGGFGLLSLHGIPKPAYRAFQILHRLGEEQLEVSGVHETVSVWAVRKRSLLTLVAVNHAPPGHPIEAEDVRIKLVGASTPKNSLIERIDQEHANAPQAWREMGSPEYLSPAQVERLEIASELVTEQQAWSLDKDALEIRFDLPPQSMAAITLELETQATGI